jgi:transcriptional regulator with XRE-family HTH domain
MISPYVRRRRLAMELRTLREQHGYSAAALAKVIGLARQTISRIENAHVRPDLRDVRHILKLCEVPEPQQELILGIAGDAREHGWWEKYRDAIGPRQALYADLEAGACTIREYQMTLLPGLLQIPPFTEARVRADRANYSEQFDPARALEARATRQQVLQRPDSPDYEVIIDELAVRRFAAPPSIVAAQLDHLVRMGYEHQQITIRVLPLAAPIAGQAVPRSAFFTYRYLDPDDPVVVAVDTITSDLVLTEPAEVNHYLRLYDSLRDASLSPADSLDFLVRVAEELPHDKGTSR